MPSELLFAPVVAYGLCVVFLFVTLEEVLRIGREAERRHPWPARPREPRRRMRF